MTQEDTIATITTDPNDHAELFTDLAERYELEVDTEHNDGQVTYTMSYPNERTYHSK